MQCQCQEHVPDKTVVGQNGFSKITLRCLTLDILVELAVASIEVVNFFDQIWWVFHPELKYIGLSFFNNDVSFEFDLDWQRLSTKTNIGFVEECLTALCYDEVILSHGHVASRDPNLLRLQLIEVLSSNYLGLSKLLLDEGWDNWTPNFWLVVAFDELFDVLLVISAFIWLHFWDFFDLRATFSEQFYFSKEVRYRLLLKDPSQVRNPDERLWLPVIKLAVYHGLKEEFLLQPNFGGFRMIAFFKHIVLPV